MDSQTGPGFLTTNAAAKLIGVGRKLFESLAEEFAGDWCRPVYFGRGRKKIKMWVRDDIRCLAHIYKRRNTLPPDTPG